MMQKPEEGLSEMDFDGELEEFVDYASMPREEFELIWNTACAQVSEARLDELLRRGGFPENEDEETILDLLKFARDRGLVT